MRRVLIITTVALFVLGFVPYVLGYLNVWPTDFDALAGTSAVFFFLAYYTVILIVVLAPIRPLSIESTRSGVRLAFSNSACADAFMRLNPAKHGDVLTKTVGERRWALITTLAAVSLFAGLGTVQIVTGADRLGKLALVLAIYVPLVLPSLIMVIVVMVPALVRNPFARRRLLLAGTLNLVGWTLFLTLAVGPVDPVGVALGAISVAGGLLSLTMKETALPPPPSP